MNQTSPITPMKTMKIGFWKKIKNIGNGCLAEVKHKFFMFCHPSLCGCSDTVDKRVDNLLQHIINNQDKLQFSFDNGEYYLIVILGNDAWGIWVANGMSHLGSHLRYWDTPEYHGDIYHYEAIEGLVPSPEMKYKFWKEFVVPTIKEWKEYKQEQKGEWLNKFKV